MILPKHPISAALVSIDFGKTDFQAGLDELSLLVMSAGAKPSITITGKRTSPDAALFIGKGKAQELLSEIKANEIEIAVFNHSLTPAQQRNLEALLGVRVIDRTSLILDIFALRAKSAEGKLQVELAQLQYLSTRLVRAWTHLERQKGGIGLRGPGETQLETDRRLIGDRVKHLRQQQSKLAQQHRTQRLARNRNRIFSVSLVGYTNAGKSTLFNSLTKAKAYAADQLFATLDTTSRKLYLPEVGTIILSDTVGFISHLPHTLIAAFSATLEETAKADLLLHVVDASSSARLEQIEHVNAVLTEIGAQNVPQILVWNKMDAVPNSQSQLDLQSDQYDKIIRIFISARKLIGIDKLREVIAEYAAENAAQNIKNHHIAYHNDDFQNESNKNEPLPNH